MIRFGGAVRPLQIGRCALLCLLAALLCARGIGDAQAASGAYLVNDVEVGAPGTCKVESWLSFARNTDFVASTVPACVFNLGPPVEISTHFLRFRSDGEWGTELIIKGKTNIIPIEPGKIGLGFEAGAALDLISRNVNGVFALVPVTLQVHENVRINLNGGWLWDPSRTQHFAIWGAGFEWNFVKPLTLIGEVFGLAGSGNNDPRAHLGLRYTPVEAFDIDVIYGRNITGEHANWITVGLNVRFGGGGK